MWPGEPPLFDHVILSAAKDLGTGRIRSLAALRMTFLRLPNAFAVVFSFSQVFRTHL